MRRAVEHGVVVAVLAGATLAHAGAPDAAHTARLAFVRGPGAERCPDEEALRAAVAGRLGYDPFRADAPQTVTAVLRKSGETIRGEVKLADAAGAVTGTRQLSVAADDCAELVASMALAISIAIDPRSQLAPAPPPPPVDRSPASAPPAAPEPPASADVASPPRVATPAPPPRGMPAAVVPPPAPQRLPAERPTWRLGVGGVIAAGAAPGISGGLTLQGGLRWRAFSVAIEGRGDPPVETHAQGGGTVSATLLTMAVVPCFHLGLAFACGRASFGALLGAGAGVLDPHRDATFLGAAGARLGVAIPIGARLALDFHGDLDVTYTPTTLELEGRDVWTTPLASAALGAGLLVHFP